MLNISFQNTLFFQNFLASFCINLCNFFQSLSLTNLQICFSNDGGVPIAIRRATKTCGSGAGACTVPSDWAVCDKNGDCDDGPTCTYYYGEESSATCNSGAINKVVCIGS